MPSPYDTYRSLGFLQTKHADELVEPWRPLVRRDPPHGGWLRLVRQALGMTTRQLAARLGVVQSRVVKLEKAEVDGSLTLKSLRQAAEALGCELVYAVVPNKPIQEVRQEQASYQAEQKIRPLVHTMALEDQTPSRDVQDELLKQKIQELLAGRPSRLWDDDDERDDDDEGDDGQSK